MDITIAVVLSLDIVVRVGVAGVRWVMRDKRTASARGGAFQAVGDGGGDVVDPRILLEPGNTLEAMFLRSNLSPATTGRLLRTVARFHSASGGDINGLLPIIAAAHTGVRGQARADYVQALKAMAVRPARREGERR